MEDYCGQARAYLRDVMTVRDMSVPTGKIMQFVDHDDENCDIFDVRPFPVSDPDIIIDDIMTRRHVEIVMLSAYGSRIDELGRFIIDIFPTHVTISTSSEKNMDDDDAETAPCVDETFRLSR